VPSVWLRRFLVGLGVLLLPAALLHAALPKHKLTPDEFSLAGQFLVASERMVDPRFQRTVILMVKHGKDGALGITINRLVGERSLATLLELLGEKDVASTDRVRIFAGGPVQPEIGFVVHTADYQRQGTIEINGEVAVTAGLDVLRDMDRGKGPQKALVAFGYAGWGPGQLDGELAREDWHVAPADLALIFDAPRERVWDEAQTRRPREP
jgi:putative transcriptional regulator